MLFVAPECMAHFDLIKTTEDQGPWIILTKVKLFWKEEAKLQVRQKWEILKEMRRVAESNEK